MEWQWNIWRSFYVLELFTMKNSDETPKVVRPIIIVMPVFIILEPIGQGVWDTHRIFINDFKSWESEFKVNILFTWDGTLLHCCSLTELHSCSYLMIFKCVQQLKLWNIMAYRRRNLCINSLKFGSRWTKLQLGFSQAAGIVDFVVQVREWFFCCYKNI